MKGPLGAVWVGRLLCSLLYRPTVAVGSPSLRAHAMGTAGKASIMRHRG